MMRYNRDELLDFLKALYKSEDKYICLVCGATGQSGLCSCDKEPRERRVIRDITHD